MSCLAGFACYPNTPISTANAVPTASREANPTPKTLPSPADAFRSDVPLNGTWRFAPAAPPTGGTPVAPASGDPVWGSQKVPGSWLRADDIVQKGMGAVWGDFSDRDTSGRKTFAGWYETSITVPETAQGRAVLLDFARISTDAVVYVDETRCGEVSFPEGQVDISRAVTFGKLMRLRVYVVSTAEAGEVRELMGMIPGQNTIRKAERDSGGLIGAVTLRTRPAAARVADVFVRTSTRKKELTLEVSLAGRTARGAVTITARAVNAKGRVEKTFAPVTLTPGPSADANEQTGSATWGWDNPRLWDLDQPNLYTLQVTVTGAGIADAISQPFGFREFWVRGRDIYLNGTPFRMRPTLLNTDVPGGWEEKRGFGFNLVELWPNSHERRTQESRYVAWYDYADERGIPITGILPHMDWMGGNYSTPERAAAHESQVRRDLRRYRNHPSIVMWGTSGNMMGATADPRYAGMKERAETYDMRRSPNLRGAFPLARRGVDYMKAQDPTRPVFIHNGGPVGDLYTLNHYLGMRPLQEREEFVSDWAKHGDMPLWYVEFGTPLNTTLFRGRNGFGDAMRSEPFLTEYCAIYQGEEAYKNEPPAYRADVVSKLIEGQKYQGWFYNEPISTSASFQALQALFQTNTWRSYRTFGMTGGMIPWDGGYITHQGKRTPAGEAFAVANAPTLAWIAGDAPAFTAKDHHYRAGQTVRKQIALLNDTRSPQSYSGTWSAKDGSGAVLGTGRFSGKIAIGETRFLPVVVPLKARGVGKRNATLTMTAKIGDKTHGDRFAFRVFGAPPIPVAERAVTAYDPAGKTSAMLRTLGYTVSPWRSGAKSGLVVVGREAFTQKGGLAPATFEAFVRGGGRLLIMSQTPDYLRKQWGLRVAAHVARRVFPVRSVTAKRWFAGIGDDDLRDWSGTSSLVDAYPDYAKGGTEDTKLATTEMPYYGYRWGTRGGVSSAPIEKPHYGGWQPVFECEFDLAYSPLMTARDGAGQVTLCTFDLEDHAALDPAAASLTRQILRYAQSATAARAATTLYIGNDAGSKLLDSMGVLYTRSTAPSLPTGANRLLIVGDGAGFDETILRTFARTGGRVLHLAHLSARNTPGTGVAFVRQSGFFGSLSVPDWAECAGLSASDLRFRAAADWTVCETSGGVASGASGLFARETVGKGSIFYCQLDPESLNADKRTYLRLTRWRQTRAMSQLIGNIGGRFMTTGSFFKQTSPADPPSNLYHLDYRADFELGDDPYRYYNW